MLNVLNLMCHGYVAVPVIIALKKQGAFRLLSKTEPVKFETVVKELQANQGHLRVAFHMLESLGWATRNQNNEYLLTPESRADDIPDSFLELYSFPMEEYLTTPQTESKLTQWIDQCLIDGNDSDITVPKHLQGSLLLPLLIAVKKHNLHNVSSGQALFSALSAPVQDELAQIFLHLKWANKKQSKLELTQLGEQIIERAYVMGIAGSYRPMLANVADLLFNDPASVFTRDKDSHEEHIDRSINVISSGFQHEKYFQDVEKVIIDIFSKKAIKEQPKYVADMGCGDGAFLKRVYEIIKEKTARGAQLDEHPVQLIGADYNEKSLEETDRNLSGLPHMVIHGDINDPEQLIADLREKGVADTENILHIRSFLDHNRPYIPPKQKRHEKNSRLIQYSGVYVDGAGNEIPSELMMDNLIEHLERWSKIINKHGIIILESHCLPPKIVHNYFVKTESFYFDAIHSFSGQCMAEAEKFIIAAANTGMFPNNPPLRYPKIFPFTRITVNHFKNRNYTVRYANENDLPALVELEKVCWSKDLQTPKSTLKIRLEQYPEGQLALEMDSKTIGVIYTQKITDVKMLNTTPSERVHELHTPDGDIVQLLSVNILPEHQSSGLGDQLLEFTLQRCSLTNGIKSVVGVTRCRDYQKYSDIELAEYIQLPDNRGKLVDPILRFHQLHGAEIKALVPNYREKDSDNNGYGVLIEYDIHNRERDEVIVETTNSKNQLDLSQQFNKKDIKDIELYLCESIKRILGQSKSKPVSSQQPLIEMGMDSASLLELNELISCKYKINLDADFFFQYFTIDRIVKHLGDNIVLERGSGETLKSGKSKISSFQNSETIAVHKESLTNDQDIAIIGMAFKFPGGATTKEKLWQLLSDKRSAIKTLPDDRWKWPSYIDPDNKHRGIDKGGFLDDISSFDAPFFRISPVEAELMDPQQRILLELTWELIEDAGYKASNFIGSQTGVFVGASGSDYNALFRDNMEGIDAHVGPGTSMSILPNRISYYFDLSGPSVQVDTACSSSLVALHDGIRAIQSAEAGQAIVGGVNIMCHPYSTIAYYRAGMLSKAGRCKTFDNEANGYVRGEGAGLVLIKPLKQAVKDCDNIYAVIKGVAINHGGQASGLTVPNPEKQAKLLVAAYKESGINPETVGYLEAHGTGTSLGDPIEISGIKTAFNELSTLYPSSNRKKPYCGLGSIKTNLGHLEAAAGIAGLIKTMLAMKLSVMPGLQNFENLNQKINLENTPFYVLEDNQEWKNFKNNKGETVPKRAGVSSFGFGGVNAHVVLEEYMKSSKEAVATGCSCIFALSAGNSDRLKVYVAKYIDFLKKVLNDYNYSLSEIVYTSQVGREAMDERLSIVISSKEELLGKLTGFYEDEKSAQHVYHDNIKNLASSTKMLTEGKLGSQIIKLAIDEKDLVKLATLWTSGIDLDWDLLYDGNKPLRICIPTYPFEQKRYWVPESLDFAGDDFDISSDESVILDETGEKSKLMVDQLDQLMEGKIDIADMLLMQMDEND